MGMIKYPLCVSKALCSTQQIPLATSISGINTFLTGACEEFKRVTLYWAKALLQFHHNNQYTLHNIDLSKRNVCIYHIHVWIFIAMLLKFNYLYVVHVPWCICISFTLNCLTSNELKAANMDESKYIKR